MVTAQPVSTSTIASTAATSVNFFFFAIKEMRLLSCCLLCAMVVAALTRLPARGLPCRKESSVLPYSSR